MNLHEYQAKNLSDFNVSIQRGRVVDNLDDVIKNSESLSKETGTHGMLLKLKYMLEVEEKEGELS